MHQATKDLVTSDNSSYLLRCSTKLCEVLTLVQP
jgi:hypothetical protein